jgi:ribose-phosphate pyrophosphokinase
MRQDTRFHAGEAVSCTHYAAFLSWTFDWLVTVDPHLHRHASLDEVYTIPARCVSAMPAIADWIGEHVSNPVLIGPDAESVQWIQAAAARLGAPCIALQKQRRGDRDVSVSPPDRAALQGRTPVVLDDIASSGRTLIEAVAQLRRLGSTAPVCIVVHGLFADAAERALMEAGAARVVSTDTIAHATNAIGVVDVLVPAVRALMQCEPEAGRIASG